MVLAHSLAMNGGVLHAIESLSAGERAAAFDGFRYFGLDAAAHVLEDIARRWDGGHLDLGDAERLAIEADERYAIVVADDDVLVRAFEARYGQDPGAFAAPD
jgi:hypothetical protein